MKTIIKSCFFILLFLNLSVLCFSQLEGKTFITSNCASGGFDYYFFESNEVIAECFGCEVIPYFQYGTYEIIDSKVYVYISEEWYGEGDGDVLFASSINHYERYVARFAQSTESFDIPFDMFQGAIIDGCEEIGTHEFKTSDPHDFLRNDLVGKYPETFRRKLTDADLNTKSKKELRFMRNEIYARYGYVFASADLKVYFENQPGYKPFSKDVEAFLSELEKENVKMIQEYENK